MEAIKWLNALLVTPLPAITIGSAHNFASTRDWQRISNAPYRTSGKKRKEQKEKAQKEKAQKEKEGGAAK